MVSSMNKKTLGICIAYYKNNEQCEEAFRKLMIRLNSQLTKDMILCIYEDGQVSDWLKQYDKENIRRISNPKNKGVSYARNKIIDYLIDKVNYMLFIDSDDFVDENYLTRMWEYCADNSHDIIESRFYINGDLMPFSKEQVRSCASGSAIKTDVIENHRFDEKLQVGEDTKFMNETVDLRKQRKKYCQDAIYYYQLGINPNSLTKKYERKEISKERKNKGVRRK